MNINKFLIAGSLFLFPLSPVQANIVPVSDYLIGFNQVSSRVVGSDLETLRYEQSLVATNGAFSLTPEVDGFGDITLGLVGARAESTKAGTSLDVLSSSTTIFDTVTFSQSATVSFNVSVTGSFSASSPSVINNLASQASIGIFDLTGTSQWVFGLQGSAFPFCLASNCALFQRTVNSNMEWSRTLNENNAVLAETIHNFPQDGGVYNLSIDVPGVLDVQAGTTYGIALSMSALAPGFAVNAADFSNTAAFNFTDLQGATFTSGSGEFLTAIPVPAAVWLFLSGLLGLVGFARHK